MNIQTVTAGFLCSPGAVGRFAEKREDGHQIRNIEGYHVCRFRDLHARRERNPPRAEGPLQRRLRGASRRLGRRDKLRGTGGLRGLAAIVDDRVRQVQVDEFRRYKNRRI